MPALSVANVSKTYSRPFGDSVRALDGVSLDVEPGESLGIIGPNGAGKTTLLGCMLGLLRPDSGQISVLGRAADDLEVRRVTGYLPERLVLDRWMRGFDFLRYHHALAGLPPASRSADCAAALDQVGLESAQGRQQVARYSRGMLQRLGLAQALLGRPRLLFLDEPISGVDPAGVMLIRRLLADLNRDGVTLVINSHQLAEVERVCTRVVFVKQGRVEAMETVRAGSGTARVLKVRLAAGQPWPVDRDGAAIAQQAGARLIDTAAGEARFEVENDAGATRLLSALLSAGIPVVEAAPEAGRLERLFEPEGTP